MSTGEAAVEGTVKVQGQPGLQSKTLSQIRNTRQKLPLSHLLPSLSEETMVSGVLEEIHTLVLETVAKLELGSPLCTWNMAYRLGYFLTLNSQVTKKLDVAVHAFNSLFLRKKQDDLWSLRPLWSTWWDIHPYIPSQRQTQTTHTLIFTHTDTHWKDNMHTHSYTDNTHMHACTHTHAYIHTHSYLSRANEFLKTVFWLASKVISFSPASIK